VIVTESLVEIL